jgi:hypothetical protein
VVVDCVAADGARLRVHTKALIKAEGLGVQPIGPLPISSRQVRSVSPNTCDMRSGDIRSSRAPVWLIGGGKTATDTALALLDGDPHREVNMVAGAGTFFTRRDDCFPTGPRRWYGGTMISAMGAQVARRFDGTNEIEVAEWFRRSYGTSLTPHSRNYLLGILSTAESNALRAGLNETLVDYLVDVVDADEPQLVLRSGTRRSIQPGSWIVNCTGYLLRDGRPYEPFISRGGRVLSLQTRSATMHLTYLAGYMLTHLLFLRALGGSGLYQLDMQALRAKNVVALPYAALTLTRYNMSLIADAVPTSVLRDCALDYDRWYPLPRRLVAKTRFLLNHRRNRDGYRRTLDTVRERFDIECGPLDYQPNA